MTKRPKDQIQEGYRPPAPPKKPGDWREKGYQPPPPKPPKKDAPPGSKK